MALRSNSASADLLFVELHRVVVPKRWLPHKELVDENAKSPPIDGITVALGICKVVDSLLEF